jgi:hypothetical protein
VTTRHRSACKAKALRKLGFTASAASPRDYSAGQWANSFLICSGNPSPIHVGGAVMLPLVAGDAWMAYRNTLYWWDGSAWHGWLQTHWTYQFASTNIFSGYYNNPDWYDYATNPVTDWDGTWNFNGVPSGYWYAVRQDMYWFPASGLPSGFQHTAWASIDAYGNIPYCYNA